MNMSFPRFLLLVASGASIVAELLVGMFLLTSQRLPSFAMQARAELIPSLHQLGRTPIAVVSAGVKSILEIGLTLEYLVSPDEAHA